MVSDATNGRRLRLGYGDHGGRRLGNRVVIQSSHPKISTQAVTHVTYRYDTTVARRRATAQNGAARIPMGTTLSAGVFNCLRGELAFASLDMIQRTARKSSNRNPNQHAVPVWTAFNGLGSDESIRFMGLVVKGYHGFGTGRPSISEDEAMTLQASGTNTIANTHPRDTIHAGDLVYWDIPEHKGDQPLTIFNNDTPTDKFVAFTSSTSVPQRIDQVADAVTGFLTNTVRINATLANGTRAVEAQCGNPGLCIRHVENALGTTLPQFLKRDITAFLGEIGAAAANAVRTDETNVYIALFMTIGSMLASRLRRVSRYHYLGKALTSALPGSPFDIYLG